MCKNRSQLNSFKLYTRLIFVAFFSTSNLFAISLEQAVFQTLHTNPDIKEKVYGLEVVKKERGIVLSAYYPKLYLSSGVGLASQKTTPAYNEQSGEQVTRIDQSIVASMNLFSGFNTHYDYESQKHRVDATKSYLDEYKTVITMQIVESYINLVKQQAILRISKENVLSHQEIYDKLKEYTDSGIGKGSDLKFASGRLTLAQVNAVVNENNFIQSKIVFESVFGGLVKIDDMDEPLFDYILPERLEDAAQKAFDYNPSIQLGKHNIKSAYSNYKRTQSTYYPTVDIELKKSWFNEEGSYDYKVEGSHAMVYFNYNLFNGFADKAMEEIELSTYLQNSQFLNFTKRDVTRKLAIAWIASIKIEEQFVLLEKMRIDSKMTLEDYYKEFLFGRRTLLDIINVKNDYNNARQSYEAAKYDLILSKFRILDAMGGLLDYFLAKSDRMKLTLDSSFVESESIYDIIRYMNDKLQSKTDFISSDDINYTSLDELMKERDAQDEFDDALDLEN